jgi:hypothetical protein
MFSFRRLARAVFLAALMAPVAAQAQWSQPSAGDQTTDFTPVIVNGTLPFDISLTTSTLSATLPTIQSYAFAQVGDNYLILAGRTNGLHGFNNSTQDPNGTLNFPPAFQNTNFTVINPVTQQVWERSLSTSDLTAAQQDALSATSTVFYQPNATTLYVAGGYTSNTTGGNTTFSTSSNLTALNLGAVINWVQTGTGSLASNIRQTSDPALQVTGGAMTQIGGKTMIVFGQNFDGAYNSNTASISQTYTQQATTLNIVDNGTAISVANSTYDANLTTTSYPNGTSTPSNDFRRRDLNVVPTLTPDGHGNLTPGLTALSGVFNTNGGVWTIPVEIDANGTLTEKSASDPSAFKQAMNLYQSATINMYSTSTNTSHNILLGGLSLFNYDAANSTFTFDDGAPWSGQTTDVVRDASGNYSQYLLQSALYPTLTYSGNTTTNLFGAGAQFLPAAGLPLLSNGMIDMDSLANNTLLGYIYGGIMSPGPEPDSTVASSYLFEVHYTPSAVPEPATTALLVGLAAGICTLVRKRRSTDS